MTNREYLNSLSNEKLAQIIEDTQYIYALMQGTLEKEKILVWLQSTRLTDDCEHEKDGICEIFSDDTVKSPCFLSPCEHHKKKRK